MQGSGNSRGYSREIYTKQVFLYLKSNKKSHFFGIDTKQYKPHTLLYLVIFRVKTAARGFYIYGRLFQKGGAQRV